MGHRRPRPGIQAALAVPGNTIFVSAASAWEIAIKRASDRLDFPMEEFDAILIRTGFEPLAITPVHGIKAGSLPRHHGDPFDRMLIAQARLNRFTLVSDDKAFTAYDVQRFGAEVPP